MPQQDQSLPPQCIVSVDDAYLGDNCFSRGPGQGSENKFAFVASLTIDDDQPVCVRFGHVRAFSFKAMRAWYAIGLVSGKQVPSDTLIRYPDWFRSAAFDRLAFQMVQPLPAQTGTEIELLGWLNTALGNLKTSLSGSHHAFSFGKYGHRYVGNASPISSVAAIWQNCRLELRWAYCRRSPVPLGICGLQLKYRQDQEVL
jgi:hypothetical protein